MKKKLLHLCWLMRYHRWHTIPAWGERHQKQIDWVLGALSVGFVICILLFIADFVIKLFN